MAQRSAASAAPTDLAADVRHMLAALAAWLEPPRRLRPTRAGWWFIVGVIAVGAAAVNTGNNLLYFVLGMMLGAIVVSGILSERNLRGLRIERSVPGNVTAGEPANLAFVVTARRAALPILALQVLDRGADAAASARVLRIDPGQTRRRAYLRTFPRRGVARVAQVEAATVFPFGLFRKSRWLDVASDIRVRPRVREVGVESLLGGSLDGVATRMVRGEGLELLGLRDHVRGDEARRIHWKATARVGRLIVKDPAREEPPAVVVRLETSGYASDAAFERAVEHAASLAAAFLREGWAAGLAIGDDVLPPSAAETALDEILDRLVDVTPAANAAAAVLPPNVALAVVGPSSVGAREHDGAVGAVRAAVAASPAALARASRAKGAS